MAATQVNFSQRPPDAESSFGCIAGMHRSGTSVTTRVAGLLGANLGHEDRFLDAQPDNPTGYWENRDITRLNDALLSHLGASWDDPPILTNGWEASTDLDQFRAQAESILGESFGGRGPAVWKDPRMSILLPFWRTVTAIDAVAVLVRHPAQVAASLAARDGIDSEKACELWTRYTADAWFNGRRPLIVAFGDLYERPAEVAVRLADQFALPSPSTAILRRINAAIIPGLQHHIEAVPEPGPNMDVAQSLFELVLGPDDEAKTATCAQLRSAWIC